MATSLKSFPISRDPPEGGTLRGGGLCNAGYPGFQFLGIPPKGEHEALDMAKAAYECSFQFLGIPPKGEPTLGDSLCA